jgi:adenosylmethionine---8-amino-7-oxononanoate aminotransferase
VDVPDTPKKLESLKNTLQESAAEIAAIIIEPLIQGAGGMKFHDAVVLNELRRLCDENNLPLIFDEIFTGFGRTGTMFACQQAGVAPDIICLAKALTGGTVPLAATVASKKIYEAFLSDDAEKALMHGPTYMAYPLGCAAANASLDLFAFEPRLRQVAAIEAQLLQELAPCRNLPGVADVRVKGAVGVVQLDHALDSEALRLQFAERGCWIRPFGDIVYLTPPFVMEANDLSSLTSAVHDVLRAN